jgi:hypothetical protein
MYELQKRISKSNRIEDVQVHTNRRGDGIGVVTDHQRSQYAGRKAWPGSHDPMAGAVGMLGALQIIGRATLRATG